MAIWRSFGEKTKHPISGVPTQFRDVWALCDVFKSEDGALCKGLRRYKEAMQEAGRVEPNPES